MEPIIWEGCYDDGWKGIIVPRAFAHPAKFSRALIRRIYDHMLERGYLRKGDTVGDCHAMLVEETTHDTLFGDPHVTRRERKSFFRQLAEKKGSPRIDYEVVLICRKPAR